MKEIADTAKYFAIDQILDDYANGNLSSEDLKIKAEKSAHLSKEDILKRYECIKHNFQR